MKASEHGLRHDAEPEAFAAAMLACEAYSPACSDHQSCQLGGSCFQRTPHLTAARMIEAMLKLHAGQAGVHFALLGRAAKLLREGKIEV